MPPKDRDDEFEILEEHPVPIGSDTVIIYDEDGVQHVFTEQEAEEWDK